MVYHDGVERTLKDQLALAVRSIQWSYAILWSVSAGQSGVLEWGDGYYNGDIKTRKTTQGLDHDSDRLGLRRSEQLRELYESLVIVDQSSPQARRPLVALSPEDLSDTEWYYLVCMSFVFNNGQGLPGRALENGETIWICNAPSADSKLFTRSLLAKSASIQTVVCFPFSGGVVELGVTDMVKEDFCLITYVKTSFLEVPYSIVSDILAPQVEKTQTDQVIPHSAVDLQILDDNLIPGIGCEELQTVSHDSSSNGFEMEPMEDSLILEGLNGEDSRLQSWIFMEDEISNCIHQSSNDADCISQSFVQPLEVIPVTPVEKENSHSLQDIQDNNHTKLASVDLQADDLHYQSVILTLFNKTSHQLMLGPNVKRSDHKSSFVPWTKRRRVNPQKSAHKTHQTLLKKVLFKVPRTYENTTLGFPDGTGLKGVAWRPKVDEITNHVLSERRRRDNLNQRFTVLKSIIPTITKVDKVSILDDTIEYLQELEKRVEKLEACRETGELEAGMRRKHHNAAERTSNNTNDKTTNRKKSLVNKRKASDYDNAGKDVDFVIQKDGSADNVKISTSDNNVVIEIKCPQREGVMLDILDAASSLHLDPYSVQSSTTDEMISVTIQSKYKRSKLASRDQIKQVLQRVAWNS